MDRPLSVTVLRCRTSDRTSGGSLGAESLGLALDPEARLVGTRGEPRVANWDDDLRDSRGCILEAGGQVDDMISAGSFPVLASSDCTICLTTFQAVTRHHPGVKVLWLDAHGDFNSPDTTPSGFLGGMCLSASCGVWDAGFEPSLRPDQVLMCGVRDLDPGERMLVDEAGIVIAPPADVPELLRGERVYVHLDLDVLDPETLPSQFAVPGGLSDAELRTLLAGLRESAEIVGVELTAFEAPEDADERARRVELITGIVAPLLASD